MTLHDFPIQTIEAAISRDTSGRLLKSFSRRLGYLHASEKAVEIVTRWLGEGGLLADVASLTPLGKEIFANIAPVSPGGTLAALERHMLGPTSRLENFKEHIRLLRSLAFDPDLFDRSLELLARIVEADGGAAESDAREAFTSLFFIYLSGTHASIGQRLRVLDNFFESGRPTRVGLAIDALKSVLEASRFTSFYSFEFGARSRDHGYHPRTNKEIKQWYRSALQLVGKWTTSNGDGAARAKGVFANAMRGLWINARMYDEIEGLCRSIRSGGLWPDGWVAVREMLRINGSQMPEDAQSKLLAIENLLRADTLVAIVRSVVLTKGGAEFDPGSDILVGDGDLDLAAEAKRAFAAVFELGKRVAQDEAAFNELLPEMFSGEIQLWAFGRGLAAGAVDHYAMWRRLTAQYHLSEGAKRTEQVLRGFICSLHQRDPSLSNEILEEAMSSEVLGSIYPLLQIAAGVDEVSVDRLRRSLVQGAAQVDQYRALAWGRATDSLSPLSLRDLLLAVADAKNGLSVALEIIAMVIYLFRSERRALPPEVAKAGRMLLRRIQFDENDYSKDHHLGVVAENCLQGQAGVDIAKEICGRLVAAAPNYSLHAYEYRQLLKSILSVQATAALDELLVSDERRTRNALLLIREMSRSDGNPLDAIPLKELLAWCATGPLSRYAMVASVVTLFQKIGDKESLRWSDAIKQLLEDSPSKLAIVQSIAKQLRPMEWTGSRAEVLLRNSKLLSELVSSPDPAVQQFVAEECRLLAQEAKEEARRETLEGRERYERFES